MTPVALMTNKRLLLAKTVRLKNRAMRYRVCLPNTAYHILTTRTVGDGNSWDVQVTCTLVDLCLRQGESSAGKLMNGKLLQQRQERSSMTSWLAATEGRRACRCGFWSGRWASWLEGPFTTQT